MPKKLLTTILLFIICALAASAQAQESAFLGKWDIQGVSPNENVVYWLEVKSNNGALEGWFLNRGGSVYKLPKISIEDGVLVFPASDRPDAPVHRARIEGDSLKGSVKVGNNTIIWVGVRPPKWGNYNANANHKYGKPVALFDGKSLDAFDAQLKNKPLSWSVVDGVMTNDVHGNNLVSKQKFQDFKIQCEYKLEDKSNSGVAPKVNASKPKGEWQEMEAVVVGNRVTVRLNGQLVQDNIVIDGITGGALDAKEGEPGPIMIQGDHEKVWFRKVVVTPITK